MNEEFESGMDIGGLSPGIPPEADLLLPPEETNLPADTVPIDSASEPPELSSVPAEVSETESTEPAPDIFEAADDEVQADEPFSEIAGGAGEQPGSDFDLPAGDDEDFEAFFRAEAQEKTVPVRDRSPQKGRPRYRSSEGMLGIPNILVTLVWLAITVAIGVTLGRMLWVCASDVLAFGREEKKVTVTIYETDTIDQITDKLYRNGLIRYPELFKLYAKFAVDDGEIRPGMWDLNTLYDYHALVKMMSPSSSKEVVTILIPEGYSCRQIFDLLQDNKVATAVDLGSYAANGELNDYWFLDGVERGDKYCLEGYLFPDTYEFYTNESPRNVLEKMLNNFNNRFDDELKDQLPKLNERVTTLMRIDGKKESYIREHQLTMRDVIIVASMIERETSSAEEGYTIASVIYNRLFRWGQNPSYLNIDATIVYALDGKNNLTTEDLQIDSPYNTYTNEGLTPGPIANPGLSSIRAALDPADSRYYYYILDPSLGSHHFTSTLEEHEAFRRSLRG